MDKLTKIIFKQVERRETYRIAFDVYIYENGNKITIKSAEMENFNSPNWEDLNDALHSLAFIRIPKFKEGLKLQYNECKKIILNAAVHHGIEVEGASFPFYYDNITNKFSTEFSFIVECPRELLQVIDSAVSLDDIINCK